MLERVANAVLFQIGWLTCVLGGNSLWLLVALAVLVIHLCCITSWAAEGRLILSVVIVGTAVDSVLRGAGVFAFQDQSPLIPLWLMLLWALLATTLRHCLAWSARPWWLASLLGAVGGALSYYAGGRLAGVQFPYGELPTLIGIGLLWALLFPLLHGMARRLAH
jgi:Ser/Thr protein kinase RdoA (MazF antagonist)